MNNENNYMSKHIGKEFISNEGYIIKVIAGGSKPGYCTISIDGYTAESSYSTLKSGQVRNPYHPSVYGKGCFGVGKYVSKNGGAMTKEYSIWKNILRRVYADSSRLKYPTYVNVKVCGEWLNFQNFAQWFENSNYRPGWALDKDILSKEAKIYSPDTCIFVPNELNLFMANTCSNTVSKYVGVSWHKNNKKWVAQIHNGNGANHLGSFTTEEEASEVYKEARAIEAAKLVELYSSMLPSNVLAAIK